MNDIKISFLGDIMFERQYLKACLNKGKSFDTMFEHVKSVFAESNYLVGNLETVCAGKEQKYSHEIYSFNSPDEVLDAIKHAGISMVTTANNHCLDRGVNGLLRTIAELDKRTIEHTGTFIDSKEEDKFLIKKFSGLKLAFLSYTYGTNFIENKVELKEDERGYVNLLKPQKTGKLISENAKQPSKLRKLLVNALQKLINSDSRMQIKKLMGLPLNIPIKDIISAGDLDQDYLNEFANQIQRAKSTADFVFLCIHTGGQLMNKLDNTPNIL